jgi:hypothetical protein
LVCVTVTFVIWYWFNVGLYEGATTTVTLMTRKGSAEAVGADTNMEAATQAAAMSLMANLSLRTTTTARDDY